MKRAPIVLMIGVVAVASLVPGCRDEDDPEYLIDLMHDRPWREHALKNLNEIFSNTMQENGNDLANPKMKELVNIMVPGLIDGFKKFTRDKFNRTEIIKILAQMNDERSVEVFMQGLDLEDTADSMMFEVSANALKRQKVERALPKLLDAFDLCVAARDRRPGAPFTNSENAIVQAVISSTVGIVTEHMDSAHKPRVVEMLVQVNDTADLLQELRLNMKAMKGLGRIGDPVGVPALVRGIAMKGERQPIGLGQIAFAALQQVHDRDAVVAAIIKLGKGEDGEFNKYYEKERKTDALMKNPTWYIQQAVDFLGRLNYASPKAIQYLEAELNHEEPDAVDETASKIEGLPVNFAPDGWATMRRNWAAVALAQLQHKPLLEVIKKRVVFKKERGRRILQLQAEEAVGYIRAMGLLLYPEESCKLMLELARAGDDSMRDKTFYNAALMCGPEFMKDMKKSHKKIDCDQVVADRFPDGATKDEEKQARNECDIMKKRIQGYMDRVNFGQECKMDLDCYFKEIANHTSKNAERSIMTAYRIARDDPNQREKVVKVLTDNLHNPSKVALNASIFALDNLTPEGGDELVKKIQEVYAEFARQSTYKDRARDLEAFIGHVRARGRK
jgi:hypothetical protein